MKSIKLYLDEDVDPLIAKVLRERGHDVLSCPRGWEKNFK